MKLLRVAVQNRRWDLAAHTIILATVNVLGNGDRPPASKRVSNSPSLRASGVKGEATIGERRLEREKRCPKR